MSNHEGKLNKMIWVHRCPVAQKHFSFPLMEAQLTQTSYLIRKFVSTQEFSKSMISCILNTLFVRLVPGPNVCLSSTANEASKTVPSKSTYDLAERKTITWNKKIKWSTFWFLCQEGSYSWHKYEMTRMIFLVWQQSHMSVQTFTLVTHFSKLTEYMPPWLFTWDTIHRHTQQTTCWIVLQVFFAQRYHILADIKVVRWSKTPFYFFFGFQNFVY